MTEKHEDSLKMLIDDMDFNKQRYPLEFCIRNFFLDYFHSTLEHQKDIVVLSVSTGYGKRDYFVLLNFGKNIKIIIATDIVDNPVDKEGVDILKKLGDWEFRKVEAEKSLPFENEYFDLVYHMDVIEHVKKPYLFLSEQYRVMKKGGTLLLGTPNIFRPANVFKLLLGKLFFPIKIGSNQEIGDYVHIQEFNEFQLKNLLEEIGFKEIEIKHCYFGI